MSENRFISDDISASAEAAEDWRRVQMSTTDYRKDPEKVAKLTLDQYEVTREEAT